MKVSFEENARLMIFITMPHMSLATLTLIMERLCHKSPFIIEKVPAYRRLQLVVVVSIQIAYS